MNPHRTTPQSVEDAGLGTPSRRGWLRRAGAGLLAAAAVGLMAPAGAHADGGKTPQIEGVAYYVLAEPRCYVRPDGDSANGPLRPRPGMLLEVSADSFRGPSIADSVDSWRWAQESGNPQRGCYVTTSDVSDVLPSDPAEIDWVEGGGLMGAIDGAGVLGALVTRGSSDLLAAPTIDSERLAEPEDGTLLDVPSDLGAWTVVGDQSLSGPRTYVPVRLAGVIAWAQSDSITAIPAVDPASLTGTFTAAGDLDVVSAPSPYGTVVATLAGGESAATGAPFAGYQPVALDTGETGWISQEEALAAAVAEPTAPAAPTTEPTPLGERFDAWTDEVLPDTEGEEVTLRERVAAVVEQVAEGNPAARAVARTALLTSGGLAVLALGLMAVGLVSRTLRKPLHTVAAGVAAAVASLAAAWMAPTDLFQPQVVIGVAVLGGVLAITVASAVTSIRGVPLAGVGQVFSSTSRLITVLAAGGAPIAYALLADGLDWPVGGLLGFLLAGAALGLVVTPGRAPDEIAAHPSPEAAPVASEPLDTGW